MWNKAVASGLRGVRLDTLHLPLCPFAGGTWSLKMSTTYFQLPSAWRFRTSAYLPSAACPPTVNFTVPTVGEVAPAFDFDRGDFDPAEPCCDKGLVELLDRFSSLNHGRVVRKRVGVGCIEGGHAGDVAGVCGLGPRLVDGPDGGLVSSSGGRGRR